MCHFGLVRASTVALVALLAAPTHAGIFQFHAQAQGGGMWGKGLGGAQQDNDFFAGAKGGGYGILVGGEVLFIDGWIEHNQYNDGSLSGTWTQLMVGLDVDFELGDEPAPGKEPKTFGEVGVGLGFGMGTGQQVDPPLDNSEISDKGFVAQASVGLDHRLNRVLSIGVTIPVQYGYLFKNDLANDVANHYHSIHVTPMAYLRFRLGMK